jgi:cell division protein FtsQ
VERVLRLARPIRLPRFRLRYLLVPVVLAALLLAGWMWFRESSFVRIREVDVVGVSSSEGAEVRAALRAAAVSMTTLHVRANQLQTAVRPFSSVAGLRFEAHFPHSITIEVTERQPIAAVKLGAVYMPVGAGGRIMRGVRPDASLPVIEASHFAPGDRLSDREALAQLAVLAEAPAALRSKVVRAYHGTKGLTIDLRNGPQLYFGSEADARGKWDALARVLAQPDAAGAVYLDARVPDRIAAGGLGVVDPEPTDPLALDPQPQVPNPQPQPESTPSLNP